jgi:hypothetical protein
VWASLLEGVVGLLAEGVDFEWAMPKLIVTQPRQDALNLLVYRGLRAAVDRRKYLIVRPPLRVALEPHLNLRVLVVGEFHEAPPRNWIQNLAV